MRQFIVGLAMFLFLVREVAGAIGIPALTYHDIVQKKNGDVYAITAGEFARQMDYLAHAGYHPVSLRALQRARAGKEALPPKPVLLTFDDGYKSYYDIAFPIMRKHGFPSVINLVTSWIDGRSAPDYTSAPFMTWDDLRILVGSPLVEVLSHTDDLHHNVVANPYGARMPAAVTRLYDQASGTYETEEAHLQRIRADLARSVRRIREELGVTPHGITWPYGSYDGAALQAAAELGLRYYLTLDDAPTGLADLPRIDRTIFRDYRTLADLGNALTFRDYRRWQSRFVTFDLAVFKGKEPAERAQLIRELERRVELLRVNTVILRPFTPDDQRAYFHTDAMPVAADVLSQIAYELSEDAGLERLILRIPATMKPRVYMDLARLNWFTGVMIEAGGSAAERERVSAFFRRFNPGLRIGTVGEAPPTDGAVDFRLVELGADMSQTALVTRAKKALQESAHPFFLIDRTATTSLATLRSMMETLRSVGAAHYGYGPDDYLHNRPAFLRIARPLAEYTLTEPRK